MEYVSLGSSGLKVSRICLGMMTYGSPEWRDWTLDEASAKPIVRQAVEQGVIFFDTADMYSRGVSEEVTGRLLRSFFPAREDYVLTTKVSFPMSDGPNDRGLSRKHIMDSIDASLRRLGTDHVDLYQIHRWDPETPIEETMEAMADVVRAGKARYIGASSMYAWQFAKAQFTARLHGWPRFVSMQNHYNLLYREEEREMNPFCLDQGVGLLPWSPLARGWLTGGRSTEESRQASVRAGSDDYAHRLYGEANLEIVDAVNRIAANRGVPAAQVALAWLLSKPGVVAPVIGATKPRYVDDAVAALELDLTGEEIAELEAGYRPQPVRGHQ
ncbi:aldo/keto reductase [Haloechinothrix sp. LS1_15]|uniref:aldo/keto reductase n=1 Tax=Haloechinothrix sp. LS1_15 TaxID=2652248 RepID=UPI00294768D7|nr:aldo/keto reductase [Haloechinothrix sp. LS1_15]MDV6013856.1 aldo/keto reductase [Haloechinothrix sp. LS1_15]